MIIVVRDDLRKISLEKGMDCVRPYKPSQGLCVCVGAGEGYIVRYELILEDFNKRSVMI